MVSRTDRYCKCGHAAWEHIGNKQTGPCAHLVLDAERHRFCSCPKFEEKGT